MGRPMFFSHAFKSICHECRTKGPHQMILCSHTEVSKPKHKDYSKHNKYRELYTLEGLEEEHQQEMEGRTTRSKHTAFGIEELNDIFEKERVITNIMDIKRNIKEILVCVDPNGGGSSYSAIIIGYYNEHTYTTVVSYFFFNFQVLTFFFFKKYFYFFIFSHFFWSNPVAFLSLWNYSFNL